MMACSLKRTVFPLSRITLSFSTRVAQILQNTKDGAGGGPRRKRTNEGGDPRTINQRRKIYALSHHRQREPL